MRRLKVRGNLIRPLHDLTRPSTRKREGIASRYVSAFYGTITDTGAKIVVAQSGNYPLYGVRMTIADTRLMSSVKNPDQAKKSVEIGDIYPIRTWAIPPKPLPFTMAGDYQAFNISFAARNGTWTELWRLRKVNGQWTQAFLVMGNVDPRYPKGALLMRSVDKDFPLQQQISERTKLDIRRETTARIRLLPLVSCTQRAPLPAFCGAYRGTSRGCCGCQNESTFRQGRPANALR